MELYQASSKEKIKALEDYAERLHAAEGAVLWIDGRDGNKCNNFKRNSGKFKVSQLDCTKKMWSFCERQKSSKEPNAAGSISFQNHRLVLVISILLFCFAQRVLL
jgi:hypothetical protein